MTPDRRRRFEDLYDRHVAVVAAYLLRRTDPTTADDVLAETMLVAWRRLDDVPADAAPWLIAIARRQLANARRGTRRRASLAERLAREPAPAGDTPAPADPAVAAALAALSPADREILRLLAWDDLEGDEIARVLGCSRATVRVRLHRARRRFIAALEAERAAPVATSPEPRTGAPS